MAPRAAAFLAAALLFLPGPLRAAGDGRLEERVTLTTEDGWNLNARYLAPAEGSPALVLLHTQKSDLTEWNDWFPAMKRMGLGYLALDFRGHGNSFITPDGSTTSWKAFAISGADNEYNRMLRDVEAALAFLSTNSVTADRVVLAGSVLGANLAIKAAAIHQDVSMVIAISPALNVNDVLSVNPLRLAYGKRPLLLVGGADKERQYKEFLLLNDIARTACGRSNVTVIVEPKGIGPALVNKFNVRRILSWVSNPRLPEVVQLSTAAFSDEGGQEEETEAQMPEYD